MQPGTLVLPRLNTAKVLTALPAVSVEATAHRTGLELRVFSEAPDRRVSQYLLLLLRVFCWQQLLTDRRSCWQLVS